MSEPRRRALAAVFTVLAQSCAPHKQASPTLIPTCAAPTDAAKFDSSRVAALAGVYTLSLVADSFPSPGARTFGRLRLRADTQRVADRPLVGMLEMNLDAIFAPYSLDPLSLDPKAPGVYFDRAAGVFAIGVQPNLQDGTSTSLTPLLVWPDGFQGRWSANYGIGRVLDRTTGKPAHVGGEFCAARVRR